MPLLAAGELLRRVRAGQRLLADGAMGTELIRLGVEPDDIVRANLTRSEDVRAIHRRYLAAGARILTSNTFGLRNGDDWADGIRAGIAIAAQTARDAPNEIGVWVSFVPSVMVMESEGIGRLAEQMLSWPSALLIETCTALPQAVAATKAAREIKPDLLAVTCHFCADGRMPDGTAPEEAARTLTAAGAQIVGGNCGDTPEPFIEIAARMRSATDVPLLFQPGAGLPGRDAGEYGSCPVGPEAFAALADRLFAAGVSIVGGCCGAASEHIGKVRMKDEG